MRGTLLMLLGAVLAAALAAGAATMAGGGHGRRLSARIAEVARPHAPARGGAAKPRARRRAVAISTGLPAHAMVLFGARPERRDQYPLAPWIIVAIAALPSALLALYLGSTFGPWARALFPAIWLAASRLAFSRIHARRAAALYRQLPDSLAMIVRAVRAGIPVVEALRTVGREVPDPTGAEFRKLSDQMSIGIGLEVALRGLAERSGLSEYAFFAVALTLQNAAGGNLTETLDNLADVVRKRVAMRGRGIALASQANASAYILAAVPVVTVAALMLINPGYILVLFEEPRGKLVFATAVGSLLGGLGVMRAIIAKSLS